MTGFAVHLTPSDKPFARPGWHRARPSSPASGSGPFRARRPGRPPAGRNGCSAPTAGSTGPAFFSSTMVCAICSTISGATPSDGSSSSTSSGLPISVRATVSICCSPPLMRPPSRSGISARLGNSANSLFRRPGRRRRSVGEAARRLAADVEIFHHGEIGEDAPVLRREAQAAPRDLERLAGARCPRR